MRAKIIQLFLVISLLPQLLAAQFTVPVVKADMYEYKDVNYRLARAGVKVREDVYYYLNEGKVTTENYITREVKFHSDGSLKEIINLNPEKEIQSIVVFYYNKERLPVREVELIPTGELIGRVDYKYLNQQLREKIVFNKNEYIISKTLYDIYPENNYYEERLYFSPDSVLEKNTYYYSDLDTGRLIRHQHFIGDSQLEYEKTLSWKKGVLVQEEYVDNAGEFVFFLDYYYDVNGYLSLVEKVLKGNKKLYARQYKYNKYGNIYGKIEFDSGGRMKNYYKYNYH